MIAFTSGTTGVPKGTMHFHRDMLAICDTFGKHVLRATPDDRFIGSPPIAFTFGLGGLVLFPLRVGAAVDPVGESFALDDPLLCVFAKFLRYCLFHSADRFSLYARKAGRAMDLSSLRKSPVRDVAGVRFSGRGPWRRASGSLTASVLPKCCTCSSVRGKRKCGAGATG